MNLTRNFYRFTAATLICFALSYIFYRSKTSSMGIYGFPLDLTDRFIEDDFIATKSLPGVKHSLEDRLEITDPDLRSLTLDTVNFNVVLTQTNSKTVELNFKGDGSRAPKGQPLFTHELKDGALIIRDLKHLEAITGDYELKIPAQIQNLEIHSISGNLTITVDKLEKLSLGTVSGNTHISAKFIQEIELNTTSGQATLNSTWGSFDAHSISGDIHAIVPQKNPLDLSFKTVSGKKTLKQGSELNSKGMHTTVESVSGDFTLGDGQD
jgi:hypothetical protein